jgi:hypothetical protein
VLKLKGIGKLAVDCTGKAYTAPLLIEFSIIGTDDLALLLRASGIEKKTIVV